MQKTPFQNLNTQNHKSSAVHCRQRSPNVRLPATSSTMWVNFFIQNSMSQQDNLLNQIPIVKWSDGGS